MTRTTPIRRILVAAVAVLPLLLTGCADELSALPAPPVEGNVLDAAGVLTEEQEQDLNTLIEDRNRSTTAARVAVLTVEEAPGSVEDYARDVAAAWEVGDGDAENGVLVLAATADRELRIETADGVRESFSDDEAEDVVEDVLAPAFAGERYAEGLTEAVNRIYRYAQGEDPAGEPVNWAVLGGLLGGIALLVVLAVWWSVAHTRRRRRAVEEEIRKAEEDDPELRLTEEQRAAYRKYRLTRRGDDAVTSPVVWLPLYIANPALYSGESTGNQYPGDSSSGGSSFGGGTGFSGGGASGSY